MDHSHSTLYAVIICVMVASLLILYMCECVILIMPVYSTVLITLKRYCSLSFLHSLACRSLCSPGPSTHLFPLR